MFKKDRLSDWINILLSGTLLNCTKLYKKLPLKFQPLKKSFSLLRRIKCFSSITALIFNSTSVQVHSADSWNRCENEPEWSKLIFTGCRSFSCCLNLFVKFTFREEPSDDNHKPMRLVCIVELNLRATTHFSVRGF